MLTSARRQRQSAQDVNAVDPLGWRNGVRRRPKKSRRHRAAVCRHHRALPRCDSQGTCHQYWTRKSSRSKCRLAVRRDVSAALAHRLLHSRKTDIREYPSDVCSSHPKGLGARVKAGILRLSHQAATNVTAHSFNIDVKEPYALSKPIPQLGHDAPTPSDHRLAWRRHRSGTTGGTHAGGSGF